MKKQTVERLADAWLNIPYSRDQLCNPFEYLLQYDKENPEDFHNRFAYLLSRPEYLCFMCRYLMNIDLLPMQALVLREIWDRKFPMLIGSRGFGKTFILSLYCLLRAALIPERKIVVIGASFRQSKFLHEYMEGIWKNAPIFRELCDQNSGPKKDPDMYRMHINDSVITALPVGNGSKIRGQRAYDIICDEFASHIVEIFENVISGFAAVSSSPVSNVKWKAAQKVAEQMGVSVGELEKIISREKGEGKGNQIVLSGTAYYSFNHFAKYHARWKSIINSKGNYDKLSQTVFNGGPVPLDFNWRDYSIIRIPFDLIPEGFMDEGNIARSKATVHSGIYMMEFGACFSKDSTGFFKRSLIESCVTSESKPISTPSGDIVFQALLNGIPGRKYIMAVDPASEVDNFSIVIIEVAEDHRKIVYCWTYTRKEHEDHVSKGLVDDKNFFSYCARKIRSLMKSFDIIHISIDAQGGGRAVSEALHDQEKLRPGEQLIWPVIDDDKPQESDNRDGLHILELCQFANYQWYTESNHGLRKDLEDKKLLFPECDPITIALLDNDNSDKFNTLEDCVLEIEELKNELSLIEVTINSSGRERWDTPEMKIGVGKKQRMRKDRYSALLMANMAARQMHYTYDDTMKSSAYGGFAANMKKGAAGPAYKSGPAWFTKSDYCKSLEYT